MSLLTESDAPASYVLQVSVVHRKGSFNRLGAFHIWKKSGWFGMADELMKFCPRPGCMGIFDDSFKLSDRDVERLPKDNQGDVKSWPEDLQVRYQTWFSLPVVCPECGLLTLHREELPDSYGFNMPVSKVAHRMAKFYAQLRNDADIYLVRSKHGTALEEARQLLADKVDFKFDKYKALLELGRTRETVFYPLASIIKDTASGGDLEARFKAFLEA